MRIVLLVGPYVECVTLDRFRTPREAATWIRSVLDWCTEYNGPLLRSGRVPPLYLSGVRYATEPPGVETIVDAARCYAARKGDCAHLCAWRCAELRVLAGEPATLKVSWQPDRRNRRLYHVEVRRGDGVRTEDPSRILGMR
jgi:hypothetical protein